MRNKSKASEFIKQSHGLFNNQLTKITYSLSKDTVGLRYAGLFSSSTLHNDDDYLDLHVGGLTIDEASYFRHKKFECAFIYSHVCSCTQP